MMEWKEVQLGEILNFRRGHDLPHEKMKAGDIPVAGSNGIIGYHNEASPVEPILTIGRSGNVGTPYFYSKAWAHNTTLYVDDFKGNDPLFLYYLCRTLPFANYRGGSAVPTLNRNHIHPIVVKYPPCVEEQKRIAAILSSLDDKIENNRKINKNLEEQAQALFKSWFVDFEPFKDGEFVDSELGLIPKGWRVGLLTDIVDVKPGGTPRTENKEYWDGGTIPFFSAKDITGLYCFDTEKHITQKGVDNCSSQLYPKDSVFLTARGTVGKVVLTGAPMAMNQSNFALFGKEEYSQYYTFFLVKSLVEKLLKKSNGAVFAAITTRDLKEKVIMPNVDTIETFTKVVTPLFCKIHTIEKDSQALSQLRDTLLPKLMNGEIKI